MRSGLWFSCCGRGRWDGRLHRTSRLIVRFYAGEQGLMRPRGGQHRYQDIVDGCCWWSGPRLSVPCDTAASNYSKRVCVACRQSIRHYVTSPLLYHGNHRAMRVSAWIMQPGNEGTKHRKRQKSISPRDAINRQFQYVLIMSAWIAILHSNRHVNLYITGYIIKNPNAMPIPHPSKRHAQNQTQPPQTPILTPPQPAQP